MTADALTRAVYDRHGSDGRYSATAPNFYKGVILAALWGFYKIKERRRF